MTYQQDTLRELVKERQRLKKCCAISSMLDDIDEQIRTLRDIIRKGEKATDNNDLL